MARGGGRQAAVVLWEGKWHLVTNILLSNSDSAILTTVLELNQVHCAVDNSKIQENRQYLRGYSHDNHNSYTQSKSGAGLTMPSGTLHRQHMLQTCLGTPSLHWGPEVRTFSLHFLV